jgi:hypothetical protein
MRRNRPCQFILRHPKGEAHSLDSSTHPSDSRPRAPLSFPQAMEGLPAIV